MISHSDIDGIVDAHIAEIKAFHSLSDPKSTEILPPRQILIVEEARYYSAGYVVTSGSPPASEAYILLTGKSSPSTDVTRGYLRFVPRDQIKAPRYHAGSTTIDVWLDIETLALTLEQLGHANRFLWIGWFAGGHVYSSFHTER